VPLRPDEIGPDGVRRPAEMEAKLNSLFASVFSGPDGQAVIDHLRSITLNRLNGPEVSSDHLRHVEGQRFLVGVILQRIEKGKRQ